MPEQARPQAKTVLVVEDEPAIADVIRLYLERGGYRVRVVGDGATALATVRTERPDAILLDVGLPVLDGIEVCRRLRTANDWTPILFVTARDDEVDRIIGLELGADDYVTKPFSPRELVARVSGVLRRNEIRQPHQDVLAAGVVRVEPGARRVYVGAEEVQLTATEFDLLTHLMQRPGWVFTREQLLTDVWGHSTVAGTRTVDVHIAQLRVKLGAGSPLRTVRGVGYSVTP